MTLAEIIEKAKNDPEFRKGIVMFAKDTDEGKEILTSHANVEFDKRVGDKIFEIHKGYEDDIFEIMGVRKKADQKTYDFVKELASELKGLKSLKPDDKDAKIKELQDKMKEMQDGGEVNGHWKKIYDEAVSKWDEKEAELKTAITQKETEQLQSLVLNDLTNGKNALKFKEGIPQEAVDAMINSYQAEILKSAKLVDGKVVYHKEDGQPWMNNEIKPITAGEIWKEKLGSIIDEKPASGGGANPKLENGKIVTVGEGDNATKKLVLDRGMFSTKVEFQKAVEKAVTSQGLIVGSKEANTLTDAAYKEYEVDKLDFQ